MRRLSFVALIAALFSTPLAAQAVRYDVTLMSTTEKQFHVAADFPAAGKETLFVSLPAWSPGNYEIQNYARYLHGFSAKNAAGQPLRWDRADKDTWRVATGDAPTASPSSSTTWPTRSISPSRASRRTSASSSVPICSRLKRDNSAVQRKCASTFPLTGASHPR